MLAEIKFRAKTRINAPATELMMVCPPVVAKAKKVLSTAIAVVPDITWLVGLYACIAPVVTADTSTRPVVAVV